jgi:hypothetical protein
MSAVLRTAAAVVLVAAFAAPASAQPNSVRLPEPLPMGVPYFYQPGNNYWYAPAIPFPSPYPFGATAPVYGRYSWDYTGQYSGGFGWYLYSYPSYPYSYQYPTLYGRVWMGYGW